MKRALAAAAIALSLFTGSVAIADDRDHGRNWDRSHDRRHDDRRDHGRNHDWRRDHDRHNWGRDNRRDWRHDNRRDDRRDWRHDRRYDHRYDHRFDRRYDHRYRHYDGYRYRAPAYRPPYGYRAHYWRRGEYLPVAYRHSGYVVHDYYAYGLRHPGRGCHWVRVNNDVVLAAITTGIVLDIAYNRFY
jgi:Ni/Co efflux regulator RcnB